MCENREYFRQSVAEVQLWSVVKIYEKVFVHWKSNNSNPKKKQEERLQLPGPFPIMYLKKTTGDCKVFIEYKS